MDAGSGSPSGDPVVIQWVLDTRRIWREATEKNHLPDVARSALALLPEEERKDVLRYHFVADAKMSLGSKLLKRYVITRYCGVAWNKATSTTRDYRKKPVFVLPDGSEPLLFNISHQAGLVVLIGVYQGADLKSRVDVGIDVVCPHERRRRDVETITTEGWPHFVDIHGDVLAIREMDQLKAMRSDSDPDTQDSHDKLLRYFYALWCLREAYVKMTGDALLADWLRQLEMRDFAPPQGRPRHQDAWFQGSKIPAVDLRLMDLLDGYMVSTSIKYGADDPPVRGGDEFTILELDDILRFAKTGSGDVP